MIAGIELAESVRNLRDAYDMAHQIGSSEINAIFAFEAFEAVSPEERKLLVKQQVDEHVARLQAFGQKYMRNVDMGPILVKAVRSGDG